MYFLLFKKDKKLTMNVCKKASVCSQIALINRKVEASLVPENGDSVDQIGVHCANKRSSFRQHT